MQTYYCNEEYYLEDALQNDLYYLINNLVKAVKHVDEEA